MSKVDLKQEGLLEQEVETEESVEEELVIEEPKQKTTGKTKTAKTPQQLAQTGFNKLGQIEKELNMELLERENEIKSIVLALATAKNVLLLGLPGTAKSMLARQMAKHITKANYFEWLLSRTSDPSELLGPVSVKSMEKDQFLRKSAGKLPEAHISFIDEIFKSNSATLNTLLPIMNERIWYNDGVAQKANLQMAVGASNEFPEDEELDAFYDRFVFRHWVEPVGDSQNQANMLKASVSRRKGSSSQNLTQITLEELEALQEEVNQIDVPDLAINSFQKLLFELKKKDIHVSDRRAVACIHIMQAQAAINGRSQVDPDDMEPLAFVLWERKEDIEDIQAEIIKMMNPYKDKINKAFKEAKEVENKVMSIQDKTQRANEAIDARNVLEKIAKKMDGVVKDAKKEGRDTVEFEKKRDDVIKMNQDIVNQCLLFSLDEDEDSNPDDLPF